ncbi:MAG: N-acetyltransferase [Actinomycetota bacterium]|nr:N-acetyltransferase [Actinomycetota bacterium]
MRIRVENPADYGAIHDLFAPLMGLEVANLVRDLRRSDNYVPDLALVAEEDGDVVGHILMSYATLQGTEEMPVLLLSPLGVRSECQHRGIGSALVRAGLDRAEARGEPLVVVEGVPSYYPRFGFERARSHGIEPPHPEIPDEAWMVRLLPDYKSRYKGRVVYPPAFDGFY